MGKAAVPKMVEAKIASYLESASWNTVPYKCYESIGGEMPLNPFMRVAVSQATERPSQSGNFLCNVDLSAHTGMDPEYDLDFYEAGNFHSILCGNINESLIEIENSNLNGTITGYTNTLAVFDIRITSFNREIDTTNGVFEDNWDLEIYCNVS